MSSLFHILCWQKAAVCAVRLFPLDIPGYTQDFERLTRELGRIWNAFLRGQIIIFFLAVIVYSIVLSVLGVHYAIGLAFVAGLARFVPYVGPAVNWTVLVLVSYFQVFKLFGLSPFYYTLLVLIIALVIDQIFDYIVSPRILSDTLKVHPAAVLVAAIVAANLFGSAWRCCGCSNPCHRHALVEIHHAENAGLGSLARRGDSSTGTPARVKTSCFDPSLPSHPQLESQQGKIDRPFTFLNAMSAPAPILINQLYRPRRIP